ncbi:MAG TPA: tetratricopeptide repeat protein, partial [Paracoccaceae bacterium]|nr:tetratricopeptide repeat protein [Paracoccaceae bacterium]
LGWYGPWDERPARINDATAAALRAIELDDKEPAAHMALGRALVLSGAAERGQAHLRRAVELDPSFAQGHFALSQALVFLGRLDEALQEVEEAFRLSPRDPHLWTFFNIRGVARYRAGDLRGSEADQRAALDQQNVTFWPAMFLVANLARQGRIADGEAAIAELHRFRPDFSLADARREFFFCERSYVPPDFIDELLADLALAGLT